MNSEVKKTISDGGILKVDFIGRKAVLGEKEIDIQPDVFDIEKLRALYSKFYYSVPFGELKEKKGKHQEYFLAKRCDELTQTEMFIGQQRSIAKADLELYVLGCLISGMSWPFDEKHWFYRDSVFPSLVLLKEWWHSI